MAGSGMNILVTGARAPVALHLARLLHGAGHRVVLADTPAVAISAASTACYRYVALPPPRFRPADYADAVEALMAQEAIDLVIPTCEEVFHLAMVWRARAPSVPLFAPGIDLLAKVHNKYTFIGLVRHLGLSAPATRLLTSDTDIDPFGEIAQDLVFKPVWSRFARDVLIRPTRLALGKLAPTPEAPWIAQDFVEGDEISVHAFARNGKLGALGAYRSLYRAGKGAGVCFEPVRDPGVTAFVEAFVSGTDWTGQISFDLIRQTDGTIMPLECNPRATSGLHFFSEPTAFSSAILGAGAAVAPDVDAILGVRLALWLYGLPQAVRSGQPRRFFHTFAQTKELLDWPGDPRPARAQWRALAGIARTAIRERMSLQAAATHDIEWNGPDQSSI